MKKYKRKSKVPRIEKHVSVKFGKGGKGLVQQNTWKNKVKCTHCGGSGYHGRKVCPVCNGTGFVKKGTKPYSLDQKPGKTMDYGGEMFKVENWMPD